VARGWLRPAFVLPRVRVADASCVPRMSARDSARLLLDEAEPLAAGSGSLRLLVRHERLALSLRSSDREQKLLVCLPGPIGGEIG
jgi:hypothetical protein